MITEFENDLSYESIVWMKIFLEIQRFVKANNNNKSDNDNNNKIVRIFVHR